MIEGMDILIISTLGLSDLPTRKQRIALKLSEKNRVVYLEPPNTLLGRILRKDLPKPGMQTIHENLIILRLPDILPFGLKIPVIQKINELLLFRIIQPILKKMKFETQILWTYLVDFPGLYKALQPGMIVYDCVDDHSAYAGLRSPRFVNRLERQISGISQVCFATTEELLEKIKPYQQNSFLVSNGVEADFFIQHPKTKPVDMKDISSPIIGYFGAIQEWFDCDLIFKTAKNNPDMQFVLVGPYSEGIINQLDLPNIHLLGRKAYEDAPAYINTFDVCLIPFKQDNLTLNISPLKFYEYCSLGKPTVSIPVRQMLPLAEICYLYETKDEFEWMIKKALSEDRIYVQDRIQVAKDNSWDSKFQFMFQKIEESMHFSILN